MAFTAATLHRMAHVGGVTRYIYTTADVIATVIASGYFNAHTEQLRQGDIIEVVCGNATVDILIISSASGATPVTTVNGT